MSKYFKPDGSLKLDISKYIEEGEYSDDLKEDVWEELERDLEKYPSKSPAVGMYWASNAANQTHGNYDAGTIIGRML
jgi:hypothetical protein